jgi:hypothetical protein
MLLQEYLRARAAAARMTEVGVVTVWERPTRVIVTAAFLASAAALGSPWPALGAWAWVGLGCIGLGQLALVVRRRLPLTVTRRPRAAGTARASLRLAGRGPGHRRLEVVGPESPRRRVRLPGVDDPEPALDRPGDVSHQPGRRLVRAAELGLDLRVVLGGCSPHVLADGVHDVLRMWLTRMCF